MLEEKKVNLLRAKEAVEEYLYGRGISAEISENPRYDSIVSTLALRLVSSGVKNYLTEPYNVLDKLVYIENYMSFIIYEGVGANGTTISSKYYIDNQDGSLKRLRLESNDKNEVLCANISTYDENGIEISLSTEQNLDGGDVYFSKATRDPKRPDVIKIERMKQVKDELTKMPEIYQLRIFMPALEDIYPDRETVDPYDVMHYSFLGMPEIYRDFTGEEMAFLNMSGMKITPLSKEFREKLLSEYKKLNVRYHRTKKFEEGLSKILEVDNRSIDEK